MSFEKRTMSQGSLDNLKLPNRKQVGHGYQYKKPVEKLDALFSLMANGMTLKQASVKAGMCYETASKYYNKGDPKRGIKPVKYRLTIYQERISQKLSALCEEKRMESLLRVDALITEMDNQMFGEEVEVIDENGKKSKEFKAGVLPKFSFRDYERMLKLRMQFVGMAATSEENPGSEIGGFSDRVTEKRILSAEQITGQT